MSPSPPYAAVVLAGGTAARMDGVDKAGIEYAGRTMLEHSLAALADAVEVVVVGEEVPTSRPVTFVREDPPLGGPAAGLLAGLGMLSRRVEMVAVVAVDMPRLTPATFERLLAAADGHDGAFLVDADGRRQLAGVLDPVVVERARPADAHGLPWHRLTQTFDLAEVQAVGEEAQDVDSWADLRDLGAGE